LLGLVLLACYLWKVWRLWSPNWASQSSRPRVAYRAGLDRLAAVGKIRDHGESRERFALRIQKSSPSIRPLTDVHVAMAMGSQRARLAKRDLENLHVVATAVGRELRASTPWWRWTLGVMNPVSWIWSR